MRIKGAAERLEISPDWLRELEKQRRIPQAKRDLNGHRRYTVNDVAKLKSILFGEQPAHPVGEMERSSGGSGHSAKH